MPEWVEWGPGLCCAGNILVLNKWSSVFRPAPTTAEWQLLASEIMTFVTLVGAGQRAGYIRARYRSASLVSDFCCRLAGLYTELKALAALLPRGIYGLEGGRGTMPGYCQG